MSCSACSEQKNTIKLGGDCFLDALETMKCHYNYYKKTLSQKCEELQETKQRNERLQRAVELLQRKLKRSYDDDEDEDGGGTSITRNFTESLGVKRHKTNEIIVLVTPTKSEFEQTFNSAAGDDSMQVNDLNVAINCNQMLDTSECSQSNTNNDSVSETEKVRSPRFLCKANSRTSSSRKASTTLEQHKNHGTSRNLFSRHHAADRSVDENCDKKMWLTKLQPQQKQQHDGLDDSLADNNSSLFKKKLCLSLNKKPNIDTMRQTRLHFSPLREKIMNAINESPQRENVRVNAASPIGYPGVQSKQRSTFKIENLTSNAVEKPDQVADDDEDDMFEMRPLDLIDIKKSEDLVTPSLLNTISDPSVIALTPATQEVIFLDDTAEHSGIWSFGIDNDQQQQQQSKAIKEERTRTTTLQKDTELADETLVKDLPDELKAILDRSNDSDGPSSSIPIPIKVEQFEELPLAQKLPSIQERFNIDCEDCLKFIGFLGNRYSDEEIVERLRKCTRHKAREAESFLNPTPEDYWNPLLQSFAEDDPRNEVLVDRRFEGKKRLGKYGSFI